MIEQHLSVDDDVVKRKVVYRVAYHHWPELLILKNMNEKRSISKLISREEAGNYGNEFVESSAVLPNDATLDDLNRMHVQTPTVSEIEVSTLVASLYRTPKKPAAVDCGVPFPFFADEPPNPISFPMVPSKTTAKPAFDCHVPFFPSNLFNLSPSIPLAPAKLLPSIKPPSNDPSPSNEFFHPVTNPPASFFSVDTNPELSTRPTPIDCCVTISSPPLHPAESNPNHLPLNPTIDCCVTTTNAMPTMPDSPDAVLPVEKIHEYIKGKVKQNGIAQELLTSKFHTYIKLLQRIHMNFDPIFCQFGIGPRTYLQAKSTMRHHTISCPIHSLQRMDQGCSQ
jgi:hypothetical protein